MYTEKDFYKKIIENLPEGVAICNSEHKIIEVNAKFEKISGYLKEELVDKNVFEVIRPSSKEACAVCQEMNEQEDQTNLTYQLGELKDKNEKLNCVRINKTVIKENYIIYLVIPFSDIVFLNQAHLDFVSTVSHELRTPLTSIKGFAETLLAAGDNLTKEQRIRFISIIKSQTDRLARLVENLLTVSKLEAKSSKTIYKAINSKEMIDTILNNLQHKAKEHKIEVNILPNLPPIWGDSDKLEQVMMNLVDNALKYSKPATIVTIEAGFAQNNTDKIEIKIKDQGFGIPEEFLTKIFTKFSRIDNPLTRQVQGTGLGLYITKSLVKSMKGDITATSNDKGSVFKLTLPVASAEMQAQQRFQEHN
ncbi:MAG TPA: ATP-binding protein [Candidatus Gastranaerophilales bacterium]|nr:ATP-binding protein [Candidatus Gastranaerophilales bacterium]